MDDPFCLGIVAFLALMLGLMFLINKVGTSLAAKKQAKKYDLPGSQTQQSRPKHQPSRKLPPVTQSGGGGVTAELTRSLQGAVSWEERQRILEEKKRSDEAKRSGTQKAPVTHRQLNPYRRVLQISVPHDLKWEPARTARLMSNLFGMNRPFNLVIRATNERIAWYIEVGKHDESAISKAIYGMYPGAQIVSQPKSGIDRNYFLFQFESMNSFVFPGMYAEDFGKGMSPMATLISAMSGIDTNEEIVYDIALRAPSRNYKEIASDILYYNVNGEKVEVYPPEFQKPAEEKLGAPLMEVRINTKIKASSLGRARAIFSEQAVGFEQYHRENVQYPFNRGSEKNFLTVLSAREVAALWHLPTEDCLTPGIVWAKTTSAPLPTPLLRKQSLPGDGVALGTNSYQGKIQDVRLEYPDRVTHVNLVGRTRVGKSTLMHNMVAQDIANGKGVAVIDPHGDLVNDILACSIPAGREQDVVLFDVTDTDYPIGLNLLFVPDGIPVEVGADQTLEVIRKMFADDWSSGRMENVLYVSLISLVTYPGATIQDVAKMPINNEFRGGVLKQVTDYSALQYWLDIHEGLSPQMQLQVAQPIINRIQRFYRNPTLRRIVCQTGSLDFAAILNDRKIFLANLGGLSDIENETLGALLISKIQMAAMGRAGVAPEKRMPFYCYIDEVQNFVTTSLDKVFSEAGKYGLSLTVANQYLGQLSGGTLDAIIGNVGTTVMFRCGHDDAQKLGRFVKPQFDDQALLNLDRFETVVKMQHSGETIPAFSLETSPPPDKKGDADAIIERIRTSNRKKYARPREEIDAELSERYTGQVAEPEQETMPGNGSDDVDDPFLG